MKLAILIRFGEIFLKGRNRYLFDNLLIKNIMQKLHAYKATITKISGRYILTNYNKSDEEQIIQILLRVFGIHSISPCVFLQTDDDSIKKHVNNLSILTKTFKVEVKRADKTFPIKSNEYARELGAVIFNNNENLKVDLTNPETTIYVEIKEDKNTYIYSQILLGAKGLPVGCSGNALLMLSGGIDSPVAGYLISKRGMGLHAIHFHSFPYTSELAKDKVIQLAKLMGEYCGKITLHIVPFTEIQESIHKNCQPEYMITIMRRFMFKISELIAQKNKLKAIVTGESLGQVASQTIESMSVFNNAVNYLPILRPLISLDKEEIISIAKKINTFNTSILPYEDCCTVFLPKKPIIKPNLQKVELQEERLKVDELINNAILNVEVLNI